MTDNSATNRSIASTVFESCHRVVGGEVFDWVSQVFAEYATDEDDADYHADYIRDLPFDRLYESLTDMDMTLTYVLTSDECHDILMCHKGYVYYLDLVDDGFHLYYIGLESNALRLNLHLGLFPNVDPSSRVDLLASLKTSLESRLKGTGFSVDLVDDPAYVFSAKWWEGDRQMNRLMDDALCDARTECAYTGQLSEFGDGVF